VLGDRLGNEAAAAATRNEREDLLDAGGLRGNAAGQSVALLFGQHRTGGLSTTGLMMKLSARRSA